MAATKDAPAGTDNQALAASPMMLHLMEALKAGKDIGHYGRLTFVMVARYFMDEGELEALLANDHDFSQEDARRLIAEVKGHGYNPPKRDQILRWQSEQNFPICPNPDDPAACNVYKELKFPDEVYDNIERFWEERAESNS
ncbi:MAG TPA: hypothetical protein VFB34_01720 [Chloroflexota bacterium]|nr:hypothetical protein [Chloroflexota bacterium]